MPLLSSARFAMSVVPSASPAAPISPHVAASVAPAATIILHHKAALVDPLMSRLMASAATPGWEPTTLDILMAANENWHWDDSARQWYVWDGTGPDPRATSDGAAESIAAHGAAGDVASIAPDPGTTADSGSTVTYELNGHLASAAEVRAFYVQYYDALGGSA